MTILNTKNDETKPGNRLASRLDSSTPTPSATLATSRVALWLRLF
jgi:hypothetical protein